MASSAKAELRDAETAAARVAESLEKDLLDKSRARERALETRAAALETASNDARAAAAESAAALEKALEEKTAAEETLRSKRRGDDAMLARLAAASLGP